MSSKRLLKKFLAPELSSNYYKYYICWLKKSRSPYLALFNAGEFYLGLYCPLNNEYAQNLSLCSGLYFKNPNIVNKTSLSLEEIQNDMIWDKESVLVDKFLIVIKKEFLMAYKIMGAYVYLKFIIEFGIELLEKRRNINKRFELVNTDLGAGIYCFQSVTKGWGWFLLNCNCGKLAIFNLPYTAMYSFNDKHEKKLRFFCKNNRIFELLYRKTDFEKFFEKE